MMAAVTWIGNLEAQTTQVMGICGHDGKKIDARWSVKEGSGSWQYITPRTEVVVAKVFRWYPGTGQNLGIDAYAQTTAAYYMRGDKLQWKCSPGKQCLISAWTPQDQIYPN